MRRKPWAAAFILGGGLLLLYLLLWPVPIDPASWDPPTAPELAGSYAPNRALEGLERLGEGLGMGPEDVDVDATGRVYAGVEGGRIVRFSLERGGASLGRGGAPLGTGGGPETLAETGGRPLGLDFDDEGNLLVADADRGLLSVDPEGRVSVLATEAAGRPFGLTDDVDVAPDGTIWFSDASWRFGVGDAITDLLEHRPNGRLLVYDPATGETRVALDSLWFANGVAVDPEGAFVLVNETGEYRVRRLWLSGPQSGEDEVFIENLPGFPDGISAGSDGIFWLALASPRDPSVDALLSRPFLRTVLLRLPAALRPAAKAYGFVLGLDREGNVVHNLQDPEGEFAQITSVEEEDGWLYLGSLVEESVGRVRVPGR